jgi:DNA-directed RNA polymerase I, II, and III subunit RPABC2
MDDYNQTDDLVEDDEQNDDVSVELNTKPRKRETINDVDEDDENETDDEEDEEYNENEDNEDAISETSETEVLNKLQANTGNTNFVDTDDDEDDSDTYEDYLQKFDDSTRHNIISEYHPELQSHNYEEIANMCVIVRDANGTPIDPLHRTLPMLTRYEKARILGERAKQINAGAMPMIEVNDNIIDGYLIAMKELEEKKIPFIIKRPLPNGGCEYWKLSDLEILL